MRRRSISRLVIVALLIVGCSRSSDRFLDAYTDVLVVRMTEADSVRAHQHVIEALARHGYTEPEFRQEFFERAQQPDKLRALVDSARVRAARRVSQK